MTKFVLAFASLIAVSPFAHAQETGVRFSGQAVRVENSTLHCTKCELTLSQRSEVQYDADGVSVDSATGTVTFRGKVRLKFADGEVIAEGGTLTTGSNGALHFSSDELQFVSAGTR
jgi:hypothetical protein